MLYIWDTYCEYLGLDFQNIVFIISNISSDLDAHKFILYAKFDILSNFARLFLRVSCSFDICLVFFF